MFHHWQMMLVSGWFGLGYGLVLTAMSFLVAGVGHGTYVVLGLSSAPCSLLEHVHAAFAAPAPLWGSIAGLAGGVQYRPWRWLFIALLCSHYGSLFWVLQSPSRFANWEHVH